MDTEQLTESLLSKLDAKGITLPDSLLRILDHPTPNDDIDPVALSSNGNVTYLGLAEELEGFNNMWKDLEKRMVYEHGRPPITGLLRELMVPESQSVAGAREEMLTDELNRLGWRQYEPEWSDYPTTEEVKWLVDRYDKTLVLTAAEIYGCAEEGFDEKVFIHGLDRDAELTDSLDQATYCVDALKFCDSLDIRTVQDLLDRSDYTLEHGFMNRITVDGIVPEKDIMHALRDVVEKILAEELGYEV